MAEKSGSGRRASQLSNGGSHLPKKTNGQTGTKNKSLKPGTKADVVHCVCSSSEDVGHMVECESCSKWSHSKCVGIVQSVAHSFPFVCPFCIKSLFSRLAAAELEIDTLRARLSALVESTADQCQAHGAKIDELNSSLQQISQSNSSSSPGDPNINRASSNNHVDFESNFTKPNESGTSANKRYNVVVSGITEPPSGTSYTGRLNADMEAVSTLLSNMADNIQSPLSFLIRDCRKLGRYKTDSEKPRSLLVTLNSTVEVSTVLSNCHQLPSAVSIRPDLSPSERQTRGILLRERRRLIDSEVSRRDIKLRKRELYVSGTLVGRVVNNAFVKNQSLGALAPQLSSSPVSDSLSAVSSDTPSTVPPPPNQPNSSSISSTNDNVSASSHSPPKSPSSP